MTGVLVEANWRVHYRMTETAGLAVHLVDYCGRRVLWDASLPFVLVDHQQTDLDPEDRVDRHGPVWAPLGARTQAGDVRVQAFRGGFELAVDFAAGPFRYTQLWRFHRDGRAAPWLIVHPGGLHPAHTYHPHWRFDIDLDGALDDAFEVFRGGRWERVAEEGWFPYTGEADADGAVWRQVDFGSGACVSVRPNQWEDAEVFAVRYHDGEWPPFGPHGGSGDQPYPAAFVGDEPLDGEDVTLWYVGHVHYDDAFPFVSGPWLRVTGFGP
ncbi:MAG: hypothetical protein D6689_16355 [Deltaproteobacteria bacterium]|nr:MAG: hypothetical protein D6689_16355 [Deltaproteobacteria bacterium]